MTTEGRKLVFGIYPGGPTGGDRGLVVGPADDARSIVECLDALQGSSSPFVVRCYESYQDVDSPLFGSAPNPRDYEQYEIEGRRPLELVLQYRSASADVEAYLNFVREKLRTHAKRLYAVQITEESNFTDGPDIIDGAYPEVTTALARGVVAAKELLRELGLPQVKVGFSVTPTFGPAVEFWERLRTSGPENWTASLDYVGLDFFPDVFWPAAADGEAGDVRSSVTGVLESMRKEWLPKAGISDKVAIHVTEHGWPTQEGRTWERQAQVIEIVVRTIHDNAERLNIERYSMFDLRDVDLPTDETKGDLFRYFGITTAEYRRKPAFETYRKLIEELGSKG